MNVLTLRTICRLQNRNQSDLAQMAGVTRQAVSLWFNASQRSEVDLMTSHLRRLSHGLGASADTLLHPLPVLSDRKQTRELESILLWDRLYPGLAEYAQGLAREELPALARLVQTFGLFFSAQIAGPAIWDRFLEYQKWIRPARRESLERLWKLRQNLKSA